MEGRLTEIPRRDALRYLGVRGIPAEDLRDQMERCAALLRERVRPRVVWKLFPLDGGFTLPETAFAFSGEDIRRHLRGCREVILLAATLGMESEILIRQAQSRSMADAVMLDALASAAVENVADNLCGDLAAAFAPKRLTARYSPGYGDFPLSAQEAFCALLNVQRVLGVSLTPGGLLIPQKTITAAVGLSDKPIPEDSPANGAGCVLSERCPYRKEGQCCE